MNHADSDTTPLALFPLELATEPELHTDMLPYD